MTTFDTGNPLGSSDPRDLFDNAENTDDAVNGDDKTWVDRFGRTRVSMKGVEEAVPDAIAARDRAETAAAVAQLAANATPFATKAEMDAVAPTQDAWAVVLNDSDVLKNGYYLGQGGVWVWSELQPVSDIDMKDLQALIRPGERRAFNLSDIYGWILGWISERGGLHMPDYSVDSGVGGNTFRVVDRFGFVALDTRKIMQQLAVLQGQPLAVNAAPNYGGQLGALKWALADPLQQFVGVVLCGDSITWGMSVTGMESRTPRDHQLTDVRNNATSPSWANLLHQHMGLHYFNKVSPDSQAAWPGSPAGFCEFEYHAPTLLFPQYAPIQPSGIWTRQGITEAALAVVYRTDTTIAAAGGSLLFEMTGYKFSLVHRVHAAGAKFEVLCNGISLGVHETSSTELGVPEQYGFETEITLSGFLRGAKIEIRTIAGAVATLTVEAIKTNRVLRFTNQGVIGTYSAEWVAGLMASATRSDDSFAFIQIGTNDRNTSLAGYPASTSGVRANVIELARIAREKGIEPIILCANAATDAGSVLDASLRSQILSAALAVQSDFIDQYAITKGASDYLADGLHPNDVGHLLMAKNIINRLEGL